MRKRVRTWNCVDNSQLAVENAAKSALALLGPVGTTHDPASPLRRALESDQFAGPIAPRVERLADLAELLGWDAHRASDYGDEDAHRTPWELFDKASARQALVVAEEAVALAQRVVEETLSL